MTSADLDRAIGRAGRALLTLCALLLSPLMNRMSPPGQRAWICQSSSSMRCILKMTRGDLCLAMVDTIGPIDPRRLGWA
jgi:hypothetical protein